MSSNHDAQNYRPPTISELAERGKQNLWDPFKPLKHWLRTAEAHKRAAQAAEDNRDLENAFLEYAKAATIVVDKIPSHSEYLTVLNPLQRKNLGLVSDYILYMFLSFRAFTLFVLEVSCSIILWWTLLCSLSLRFLHLHAVVKSVAQRPCLLRDSVNVMEPSPNGLMAPEAIPPTFTRRVPQKIVRRALVGSDVQTCGPNSTCVGAGSS